MDASWLEYGSASGVRAIELQADWAVSECGLEAGHLEVNWEVPTRGLRLARLNSLFICPLQAWAAYRATSTANLGHFQALNHLRCFSILLLSGVSRSYHAFVFLILCENCEEKSET